MRMHWEMELFGMNCLEVKVMRSFIRSLARATHSFACSASQVSFTNALLSDRSLTNPHARGKWRVKEKHTFRSNSVYPFENIEERTE